MPAALLANVRRDSSAVRPPALPVVRRMPDGTAGYGSLPARLCL